jgi:hypothetical protein
MNRRNFLRLIGVGVAASAVLPIKAAEVVARVAKPRLQSLVPNWFQTTRVTSCYSAEYERVLAEILNGPESRSNFWRGFR